MTGPTPTPAPVQLPLVPEDIWWFFHDVTGHAPLYGQQMEPSETATAVVGVSTPTPTSEWLGEVLANTEQVLPPDFPLQIQAVLPELQEQIGEAVWSTRYYLNAPFDLLMQSLLGLVASALVFFLTWTMLSSVVLPLVERLSSGRFTPAAVASSTYLFCISLSFSAALLVHIWWDMSPAWP